MNPLVREESLFAVVIVVNDTVFRSIRGEGEDLGILYLGTDSSAPADADEQLLELRLEVGAQKLEKDPNIQENLQALFTLPGAPPERPWIAIVHLTVEASSGGTETHFWIARDFKEMTNIPLAGAPNEALLIFHEDKPDKIDSFTSLSEIRAIAPTVPEVVFLVSSETDASNLGSGAGDYGAAADLDE